ncbi:MAG: hypothetical protein ACJ73N_07440 [Bryobacteraceae bacterium]
MQSCYLSISKTAIFVLTLFCALTAHAQRSGKSPRKRPGTDRPVCSPGAICFSGEVFEGQEFRKTLNEELAFVLEPGWNIAVVPNRPEGDCREFASVVNAPHRAHRDLYVDTSYGWTAEQEVSTSPREFRFVTNCTDYQIESERLGIVLWGNKVTQQKYEEAMARLGTLASGKGRLWITDSRITHSDDTPDNKLARSSG